MLLGREEQVSSTVLKRQLVRWEEAAARGQDFSSLAAEGEAGLGQVLQMVGPLLEGQVGKGVKGARDNSQIWCCPDLQPSSWWMDMGVEV